MNNEKFELLINISRIINLQVKGVLKSAPEYRHLLALEVIKEASGDLERLFLEYKLDAKFNRVGGSDDGN